MEKNRLASAGIVFGLILLAIVLSVGCAIWDDHRDLIMENQKNQMLITSEILAKNMELSLETYRDDLLFLSSLEGGDDAGQIYQQYLGTRLWVLTPWIFKRSGHLIPMRVSMIAGFF